MFVVLIVSSIFLLVALILLSINMVYNNKGRRLPAKIVGVEKYTSYEQRRKSGTFYRPIVEYFFNGEAYRFTSGFGSNTSMWSIGQKVFVQSLPEGPEYVKLVGKASWIFIVVFGLFGIGGLYFYYSTNGVNPLSLFLTSGELLIFVALYFKLKSENLWSKIVDSAFKNELETEESLKGREIFWQQSLLDKEIRKYQKAGLYMTLLFFAGLSYGMFFMFGEMKGSSRELIEQFQFSKEYFETVFKILKKGNDGPFLGFWIMGGFNLLMIYSLLFQFKNKR